MNVNYKTHPILEKLEQKSLGKIPILEIDAPFLTSNDGLNRFQESFKRNLSYFKKITYVSKEFWLASHKAAPKLADLYQDIITNNIGDIDVNGTFVYLDAVFFIKHIAKKDSEHDNTTFFAFHRSGTPMCFFEKEGHKDDSKAFAWVSNFHNEEIREKGVQVFIFEAISNLILVSMFKSFASVETRYISAKSNSRSGLKKYHNGTNLGITYLTSKWFTTLVRSEGFSVSGHFRLQPKKVNGEWTKELIWIDTFEKSGYTHKAQILSEQKK